MFYNIHNQKHTNFLLVSNSISWPVFDTFIYTCKDIGLPAGFFRLWCHPNIHLYTKTRTLHKTVLPCCSLQTPRETLLRSLVFSIHPARFSVTACRILFPYNLVRNISRLFLPSQDNSQTLIYRNCRFRCILHFQCKPSCTIQEYRAS